MRPIRRSAVFAPASQMGVATAPGSNARHADVPRRELLPEGVSERLNCELGGVVGPQHWPRDSPAHRAYVDDSSFRRPEELHKGLGEGKLPNEVDLYLPTELVDGDELQGRRHGDARVVDKAIQSCGANYVLYHPCRLQNLVPVRDVQDDGLETTRGRAAQALCVLLLANARNHRESLGIEMQRRCASYPFGCPTDENRRHCQSPLAANITNRCSSSLLSQALRGRNCTRSARTTPTAIRNIRLTLNACAYTPGEVPARPRTP